MSSFIDSLAIPDEDKVKLKHLGAESPFGLLSLMDASPRETDAYLGTSAPVIRQQVSRLVPSWQSSMSAPAGPYPMGAKMNAAPELAKPTIDLEKRDRLFAEFKSLSANPATRGSSRTKQLERELTDLMES